VNAFGAASFDHHEKESNFAVIALAQRAQEFLSDLFSSPFPFSVNWQYLLSHFLYRL
jgi:hypothetical protein